MIDLDKYTKVILSHMYCLFKSQFFLSPLFLKRANIQCRMPDKKLHRLKLGVSGLHMPSYEIIFQIEHSSVAIIYRFGSFINIKPQKYIRLYSRFSLALIDHPF